MSPPDLFLLPPLQNSSTANVFSRNDNVGLVSVNKLSCKYHRNRMQIQAQARY